MQVLDSKRPIDSSGPSNLWNVAGKKNEKDLQRLDSNMEKHCAQWMKFPNCEDYCDKRIKPSDLEDASLERAQKDCSTSCEDARAFCEYQKFIQSLRR